MNAIALIVTIIGVLGTFAGIAWGLLNFDTNNVEASVPKLLEGLKAAFITSIFGIAGSIALKWSTLNNQRNHSDSAESYSGATVDDLADLLRQILEVEKEEGKETRESLQSIEKSLTGEGDSTVLTQLQKLRTTFSDKQDDLVRAFRACLKNRSQSDFGLMKKVFLECVVASSTPVAPLGLLGSRDCGVSTHLPPLWGF